MKLPVGFILLAAPVALFGAQEHFYIGDYTGPGRGEGIYESTLDTDTGKLGPVTLEVKADGPGYLALSPDGSRLYAVTSNGGGSVSAYAIGKDGSLTFLNQVPSDGSGPCYVSVDPAGKNALVANYGSGSVASIKIKDDGSLGDAASRINFTGLGPNPNRQTKPYGHFIATDSTGRFVYACDLGTDHVWSYHFDTASGKIMDSTDKVGMVPPGSGPRHLAFGPGEDFAYVNGEMGHNITVLKHDKITGSLEAIQTLPLDPNAGPRDGVTSAEVYVHPSGKWVYVSSRGDDIMAVFQIGADGKLTFIQDVPALVKTPRGFGIDPTGHWLITGGQDDNQLAVLEIAQDTGKLTATDQRTAARCPICILFAPEK